MIPRLIIMAVVVMLLVGGCWCEYPKVPEGCYADIVDGEFINIVCPASEATNDQTT